MMKWVWLTVAILMFALTVELWAGEPPRAVLEWPENGATRRPDQLIDWGWDRELGDRDFFWWWMTGGNRHRDTLPDGPLLGEWDCRSFEYTDQHDDPGPCYPNFPVERQLWFVRMHTSSPDGTELSSELWWFFIDPHAPTPVDETTWGRVKASYDD